MNKQIYLDPFQNVVASGTAICDFNKLLGTVLEKITLVLGGTSFTNSNITLIQLKANAKVIWESTGANVNASNLYNGATNSASILKIDFMDRKAVTVNARQAGTIDLSQLSGITNLRLEVTISGATAPTLSGMADVSPPTSDANEVGIRWLMARRHRASYVVTAAGQFALPVPHIDPAGGGSSFRRIYLYSQYLTAIKTVRDGITEHDIQNLAVLNATQQDNFKVPQASLFVFDPVQTGTLLGNTWDTKKGLVGSAQFYGTFSAGETITIETEELLTLKDY